MDIVSSVSWFKKYQPKTVDEYVFESEKEKNNVMQWIDSGVIPGNLLLYGKAGTGKSALAHLLIHAVIKSPYDVQKLKDKKVETIDALHTWCQKAPVSSKRKIVYIEEIDRCSTQAFNSLKDELMEKYQAHVSFVATTNFLARIEHAVRTRFTHHFNLGSSNLAGTYDRLATILNSEGVQWTQDGLKDYVLNYINLGMRDMINGLQTNVVNGVVDFSNIKMQKSEQEEELISATMAIIEGLLSSKDLRDKMLAIQMPRSSSIASYYDAILELVNYNYELNYETVFLQLAELNKFGPLKPIIDRYMRTMDGVKYPHVHFEAFLYELMKCVVDINI